MRLQCQMIPADSTEIQAVGGPDSTTWLKKTLIEKSSWMKKMFGNSVTGVVAASMK